MNMACPSCGSEIAIPEGFTGVQRQCTSCRKFVLIPPPSRRAASQPAMEEGTAAPPARRRIIRRRPERENGPFEIEQRGMNAGLMGGIVMMAIAVLWFVGGLAAGIIFFYPPIMFFVGLIATISAVLSGGSRRSPRVRRRRG